MSDSHLDPHTRAAFALAVGTTSLAFVITQLDVTIVNVALPTMGSELTASLSSLQWVVDAYTLALASLMLSAGAFGDRYGARRVFQFGFVLFILGSVGCALAPNILGLNLSRALQGAGAAAMLPNSLALLNHVFSNTPGTRARAIGWWTAAGAVSIAAGPVIGGLLLSVWNWRSIFWINIPLCLLGIALAYRLPDIEPRPRQGRFDWFGQTTSTFALVALTSAVIQMHSRGLTYPLVAGSLIAGVLAAAGFIAIEARSAEPMLPLQLFSVPRFRIAVAFGMVVNLTYYGVLFVLTLFFQRALAFTPLSTGLAFLPLTAGFFVSNVVSGRFVNTFGSRIPMMVGAAIDLIGFILLARVNAQVSYGELILPFLLIPTGMGLAVPAMTGVVLQSVPKSYASTGSAVLNTARQTAGALGVAVFGSLAEGDVEHVAMAVRTASLISGALLVGAIVLAHRMGFSERTTVAHSRPN